MSSSIMKLKRKPKVWAKHIITTKKTREQIGYIQLVDYLTGGAAPHIEFSIYEEYRGQGIMSRELSKYLKKCKKYGDNRLIAVVKNDNAPSMKLLEKSGFVKFGNIGDKITYLIDLNHTPQIIEKMIKKIYS